MNTSIGWLGPESQNLSTSNIQARPSVPENSSIN